MPAFPSDLVDWLRPGAIGAGFAVVWAEIRSLHRRFDEQTKRIDELREDMKEIRADMKASETRQAQRIDALRAEQHEDNRALNEKLDRLVEASLTAKQS